MKKSGRNAAALKKKSFSRIQRLLNRNEIVQGPSPKAIKALRSFPADQMNFYFEGYHGSLLIPKLSKEFGVAQDRIIVGYGLEDILRTIFDALDPRTDIALIHEHHYGYYDHYLNARGVQLEKFRMVEEGKAFTFDVEHCMEKINTLHPRAIFITSPNNPTGNVIAYRDLVKLLKAAGKNTLVVLDEAYAGFDLSYDERKTIALTKTYANLVILRSFSKLYALAGLRIGFALCGSNVKTMLGHQGHYLGGSRLLEEIAIAALESKPYYRKLSKEIIADRERFIRDVNKLHYLKAYESHSNLVAVHVAPEARTLLEAKAQRMRFVVFKFCGPELIRVSLAPRKYMEPFVKLLKEIDRTIAAQALKKQVP